LLPVEFTWETDHRNLTFEDASDNIKVRRWGLFIGMFFASSGGTLLALIT
jgi:hypothetical protein